MNPLWQDTVQQLVDDGAELVITDPTGDTVFSAPLARACRPDADNPRCLWLRPLAAPFTGPDETLVFSLSQCRRRGLDVAGPPTPADGGGLLLPLANGQQAHLRPATGTAAEVLDIWDTFVGSRLTGAEEQALDALLEDSWTGRYA
ncbi:hypothetical protein [Actinoplanes sp. G11-F43]|uniref:hypothetical protein n=1 Tax=Actinoplanes sp. G11-F43 TaxID=3424130 RepID=UPI003D33BED2